MNFGQNYQYVEELLDLARDIAALDYRYIDFPGALSDAVRDWQARARDLVAKMDN